MAVEPVKTRIQVRVVRAMFCPDGKDHFIIHNEDGSIYIDTSNPRLIQRTRWVVENDLYQYWEADIYTPGGAKAKPRIRLVKRINKDLNWDLTLIENLTRKEQKPNE